ncbi:MAG: lipase maturation factor family protein [Archangium sp.]|nr:lipase maturation factor family protein [Archangium sp.]
MRLTRRLFFIGLGLTAMIAVGSYWWQLPGLAGSRGIAPIGAGMEGLRGAGDVGFFDAPTLLWLSSSDAMLHLLCAIAFFSAALLVAGLAPRIASVTLWASWLSLVQAGYPFLAFQWDVLLVESAFCAAFFAPPGLRPRLATEPEPHAAFRWVLLVLACKVTLESGIVKLASGDPSWRDLTALTYHWWSQPLPTWTSVLIAGLPMWLQQLMCFLMFVLELAIPLMALGPRLMRLTAAAGLTALQAALFAAGNYSFYNVLTFVLAVPLLDDFALRRLWKRAPWSDAALSGATSSTGLPPAPPKPSRWPWAVLATYAAISLGMFFGRQLDSRLLRAVRPFDTVNAYGAFAVMTKSRAEIVVEGSVDAVTWVPYGFPWKPGDLTRRPGFIAPWQPRLDWQMWFAALGSCASNPWVVSLQQRLLTGTPQVLALFETNPFPTAPPRYLRTRVFQYRFAPWSEQGVWWTRTETGPYCPPVMLGPDGSVVRAF